MRSKRQDDHSRPQVEAIKEATDQLSRDCPGFIAVQLEDIESKDLTLPHLRERCALFSGATFYRESGKHLASIYFCAFRGYVQNEPAQERPSIVFWNPVWKGNAGEWPFSKAIPNSTFAKLLGVDPAATDPDGHIFFSAEHIEDMQRRLEG